MYVTTRTISLLPAVRRPEPRNRVSIDDDAIDGKRFSVTDAQTVLQLYHHLAELLSVAEIYVVYDGLNKGGVYRNHGDTHRERG